MLNFKNIYKLFIQAKPTPNPNFLKFIPGGKSVMLNGTYDFTRPREAKCSPLAQKLFMIDGVTRVFYGKDYISIAKKEDSRWDELKPQIFEHIMEHYQLDSEGQEKKLIIEGYQESQDTQINENDSEVVQLIKEIIDTRIRPTVQEDGGDIVFRDFDETSGIVQLYMKGSCAGCPSSSVTLKNGIEKMLCHYIAEVKEVVAEDYNGSD
ncbi:unnamed protein product [Paramecium pentaurelia]|uniref:Scaffold protein Nfu/NifU N-terminal domain-containing protein n=1 Tax=Paramecium pentaurelia TaxID=43138 RepID=A0A8S1S555_9CILI|nr:unnamed protein product [Paramecium pentaurelia]